MPKIDKAMCLHYVTRDVKMEILENEMRKRDINYSCFNAGPKDYCGPKKLDYIDVENPDISKWIHGVHRERHYNAFMCHKAMIMQTIFEGKSNLLMLEDDAYITKRFDAIWNQLSIHLDKIEWDIIYLGWWIRNEGDWFNEKIEREYEKDNIIGIGRCTPMTISGLHGALINRSLFGKILSFDPINPIDCQIDIIQDKINSYYIFPKIIHTKTMLSMCESNILVRKDIP